MNSIDRPAIDEQVLAMLTEDAGRIPVVVGPCGSGRSSLLCRLQDRLGARAAQYVDVERTASTPERFLAAMISASPLLDDRPAAVPSSPREAFDGILAFFAGAHAAGHAPAAFLLDEVLEFRTFESFPGLRRALHELLAVVASSPNRFVLTSRYAARAARVLASASGKFVLVPMPPLTGDQLGRMVTDALPGRPPSEAGDPAADAVVALLASLSGGRPSYARAIVEAIGSGVDAGATPDPAAALAAQMEPHAALWSMCAFSYELRLHRARGYGALKAVLEILAEQEPLTLAEVARRLGRTPGSTRDYLSWLEDVDLVAADRKRYRFRDPLLRMWTRLYCRPSPPTREVIGREVRQYVSACAGWPGDRAD